MDVQKHVSLNLNVRGMPPSATIAINEESDRLRAEGRTVHKLGLGQSPFPVPDPVVEALRANAHQKAYLPAQGLPELRRAVAEFHHRTDGVELSEKHVLIGPGSKELMFLLQLSYYGDIVVPSPCWVSYVPQAKIIGRGVRIIPTSFEEEWRLSPERFARLCDEDDTRPRILVLNYPGNPEGRTYGADELREIAEVARRFEVILLSDEIYGQLHHKGEHVSVARFYPEGTIVSSGLSKWCGAGGWRLGTFSFPPALDWLCETMTAVASETFTSVSAPIQYAAVTAFRGGAAIERYLVHARRILSALGHWAAGTLSAAGVRVYPPEGAFYLFADFTPLADRLRVGSGDRMCRRLLQETGVAVLPGVSFHRPPEELTARLAYVDFDGAAALKASESVPEDRQLSLDFLRAHCRPTVEAIEKIAAWVATQA